MSAESYYFCFFFIPWAIRVNCHVIKLLGSIYSMTQETLTILKLKSPQTSLKFGQCFSNYVLGRVNVQKKLSVVSIVEACVRRNDKLSGLLLCCMQTFLNTCLSNKHNHIKQKQSYNISKSTEKNQFNVICCRSDHQ